MSQDLGVKLDPNQVARQRKKIEKDRRRKYYDDLQVQGTNNSSIVSKRSVEMLYTNKLNPEMGEWFKFFVTKPKRRSPAINRGYWIRMESIRQMVLRIVEKNKGRTVHVVNLGCGFDPLPFQLLSSFSDDDVTLKFLDIDYPELVHNKLEMIQEASAIKDLIGYETRENISESVKYLNMVLSTNNYKLVGCDLKDDQLYRRQLDQLLDEDSVKIFIAEVSLAYMKPEFANPIIKHSGELKNSHFVILEQILPDTKYNAFAQKMMYHFDHLRSPLQCVESYPFDSDQITRFKQYFPHVELRDLFGNWTELVDEATRSRVAEIETFDEWEEFIVFCQHYVIVHATNMENQQNYQNKHPSSTPPLELDQGVKFELESSPQIALKFPAVESLAGKIYIHGGLDQTRTDKLLVYENGNTSQLEAAGTSPSARMCHSMTAVGDSLIVMGGRSRPGLFYQDVYRLQKNLWSRLADLPQPRSRHSAVRVGNEVLVFGGLQTQGDLFVMYNEEEPRPLKVVGTIPNLASSMMAYNGEFGVIVGGMYNSDHPLVSSAIYKFEIREDTIEVSAICQDPLLARIGCRGVFAGEKLLIIGGVSPGGILHRNEQVITVEMKKSAKFEKSQNPTTAVNSGRVRGVEIPVSVYVSHPPILIGFGISKPRSTSESHSLSVLGGGGVCYSFGSTYNSVYRITWRDV